MSGITLMFSGIVLISNGLNYLDKVEDNSNALINIFTGLLYIFLNVMICVHGIFAEKDSTYYGDPNKLDFIYSELAFGQLFFVAYSS
ncbi:AmiS/UreI family transporter, partial [Aerococcus sp. Group 1]